MTAVAVAVVPALDEDDEDAADDEEEKEEEEDCARLVDKNDMGCAENFFLEATKLSRARVSRGLVGVGVMGRVVVVVMITHS